MVPFIFYPSLTCAAPSLASQLEAGRCQPGQAHATAILGCPPCGLAHFAHPSFAPAAFLSRSLLVSCFLLFACWLLVFAAGVPRPVALGWFCAEFGLVAFVWISAFYRLRRAYFSPNRRVKTPFCSFFSRL